MKKSTVKLMSLIGLGLITTLNSCSEDDGTEPTKNITPTITTPTTYEFSRNGSSSVSYSGQTDRLNQLAEIKDVLKKGDNGEVILAKTLEDMFANTNDNGGGNFSFTTTKQLKSKTFTIDQTYFEDLFNAAEQASNSGAIKIVAANGTAGLATRASGKTILVDENGREFTQLIEKGLMGATFYNQIVNTYLTDERVGDQVNNADLEAGKNYTKMEHHMDEAFGYVGAPVDFRSNYSGKGTVRYWANYSNNADDNIQMNDRLMNAFKRARAAIVEKKYSIRDEEVAKIHQEFEVLIAATAIHYANETKAATNDGDRLHVLSECYAFTRALRYSNMNNRKLTQAEVDDLLENKIGSNFWKIKEQNLNLLIDKLASTYELEAVKDQL